MTRSDEKPELGRTAKGFQPPLRPSLRGRIATRLVRVAVKHWAKGDPPAVVRRARQVFELPNLRTPLVSRGMQIEPVDTRLVRGEWIRPQKFSSGDRVVLYFHGGGYVSCSAKTHRPITATLARMLQSALFALDYRLAPEHPFPAAVDDAAAAFQWLVAGGVGPENIAIAGDSAGGGLALAAILRLRAQGCALPACAVGLSPWVDLTGADKYRNSGTCSMFQPSDVATFAKLYLHGVSASVAEASPLFGDLRGFPPLLTQVSSTELLLDDALRLHEKARSCGVESTLSIFPGLPHVWQIFVGLIPEATLALEQVADFVLTTWSSTPAHPTAEGDRSRAEELKPSASPAYNREDATS